MDNPATTSALVEPALAKLADAMARQLGDRLVSATLYGSAARGLYRPGASDINVLLVLGPLDLAAVRAAGAVLATAGGTLEVAPYLVTEAELPRIAQAFPTRVLEMKRGYTVLRGRDVLAGITIDHAALAARCCQELLNLLLRFRHLLLGGDAPAVLERDLHMALPPFIKILRTLIYLRTGQHIDDRQRIVEIAAAEFGLPEGTFLQLLAWRSGQLALSDGEWGEAAGGFFDGLNKIAEALDV